MVVRGEKMDLTWWPSYTDSWQQYRLCKLCTGPAACSMSCMSDETCIKNAAESLPEYLKFQAGGDLLRFLPFPLHAKHQAIATKNPSVVDLQQAHVCLSVDHSGRTYVGLHVHR